MGEGGASVLPVISCHAIGIRGVDPAGRLVPRLVPMCGKIFLECNGCMTMYVSRCIVYVCICIVRIYVCAVMYM